MNDVATVESTAIPPHDEQPNATAIIQVIERAASNPDIDVDKMERLLQMQERILDRQAESDFAAAMTRVQGELPTVERDAKNDQTNSKYSRLETISKRIKPIYTREGFSITFSEGDCPKDGHIRIVGILRHQSGHKETHHADIALDSAGIKGTVNKTATHAGGSTYSYGRRYLTCLMFDVATGDDNDGNGPAPETISAEQVANLEALISETGADKAKYLAFLKIDALADMPAKSYDAAVKWLEAKRRQKREPGEDG